MTTARSASGRESSAGRAVRLKLDVLYHLKMPTRHFAAALVGCFILPVTAQATPPLRTPWPCGVEYRVTQGHNIGSHVGFYNAWAWDFGIPVGGEVAAPAAGVVRAMRNDSTSGGCNSSFVNDANFVAISHGDGTEASFTHLLAGSSQLQVGDSVEAGQVIGQVGLSGWVCGAHLHFTIQKTCSTGACETIPAAFAMGDYALGETVISDNCGPCNAVLDGGTTVIEEMSGCFDRATTYWWSVAEGSEDHHLYTLAADTPAPETTGTWRFDVTVAGRYLVEAFIPETEANSTAALYRVTANTETVDVGPIDQSLRKGWVGLGEFEFAADSTGSVMLADNTGEPIADARRVAFDALRLTFVPPIPEPDPDVAVPGGDTGAPGTPDIGPQTPDMNMNGPDRGDVPPRRVVEGDGACGCGTARRTTSPIWLWLVLAVAWRRRSFTGPFR